MVDRINGDVVQKTAFSEPWKQDSCDQDCIFIESGAPLVSSDETNSIAVPTSSNTRKIEDDDRVKARYRASYRWLSRKD